jgi:hypothetical protein
MNSLDVRQGSREVPRYGHEPLIVDDLAGTLGIVELDAERLRCGADGSERHLCGIFVASLDATFK